MKWMADEVKYLKDNYEKYSLKQLKDNLFFFFYSDRTEISIRVKYHRLMSQK